MRAVKLASVFGRRPCNSFTERTGTFADQPDDSGRFPNEKQSILQNDMAAADAAISFFVIFGSLSEMFKCFQQHGHPSDS